MADSNMQLNWTDEQWNKVRQVVYEEARRARVAGNFLPLYGPLEPDATYVSKEQLKYEGVPGSAEFQRISVNNTETQPLLTLEVLVYLRGAQVADPELTSAISAFRRAANVLSRVEDTIVFYGKPSDHELRLAHNAALGNARDAAAIKTATADQMSHLKAIWNVTGADEMDGLAEKVVPLEEPLAAAEPAQAEEDPAGTLVSDISSAISQLEKAGHLGPFACVLGHGIFKIAQTPNEGSLVLPQDRILPFLGGGPLLRTSTLYPDEGYVVASGGVPIDLVVGTDISVCFLQITLEPRFVFRVYEKIALRVKEEGAIVRIRP
jgi:uncharacterized linocin/CFP29 family protein